MSENIGIQKREGYTLFLFIAPLGAFSVPSRAAIWDDNSFAIIFMLIIAQTVFTIDKAFSIDITLVP